MTIEEAVERLLDLGNVTVDDERFLTYVQQRLRHKLDLPGWAIRRLAEMTDRNL
jgi:hypothetical protein